MSTTVRILNSKTWVTAQGEILEPKEMTKDHISNCMTFMYRKRDWLLFNATPEIIEACNNPDEFYEEYVKKSVIWREFMRALKEPKEDIIRIYEEDGRHEGIRYED